MFRRIVNVGVMAAALWCATGLHARAQRISFPGQRRRVVRPPAPIRPLPEVRPREAPRAAAEVPPEWMNQLQEMGPAERDQFLKNNERFRGLPSDQQALIRQRLKAWDSLPPEQRQALLDRQRILQQLPPDQRREVRESLLPRWQSLPPRRRQVIVDKLRELRGMDSTQRSTKLTDEAFLGNLNPDERQMLRDLANLGVN